MVIVSFTEGIRSETHLNSVSSLNFLTWEELRDLNSIGSSYFLVWERVIAATASQLVLCYCSLLDVLNYCVAKKEVMFQGRHNITEYCELI